MSQHNICCQFNLRALYYLLLRLDEQAISLSVHMGASIYILAWDVERFLNSSSLNTSTFVRPKWLFIGFSNRYRDFLVEIFSLHLILRY